MVWVQNTPGFTKCTQRGRFAPKCTRMHLLQIESFSLYQNVKPKPIKPVLDKHWFFFFLDNSMIRFDLIWRYIAFAGYSERENPKSPCILCYNTV